MLKVESYARENEARIIDFIRKVQADAVLDMDIIECSVLIKDGQDVVGMVSYESDSDLGVIRYFLYDACIAGTDIVIDLFFELYKRAHERGVKKLIAGIPNREVGVLFEMLGFTKVIGDLLNVEDAVRKNVEIMLINLEGELFE